MAGTTNVLTGHPCRRTRNREWWQVNQWRTARRCRQTAGKAGTALENHFAVIPADRNMAMLLKPFGRRFAEAVDRNRQEGIFCDEHGRVRVKFNWDRSADQAQFVLDPCGTGVGRHRFWPPGDTGRVGQGGDCGLLNGDPTSRLWGVPTMKTAHPAACRGRRRRRRSARNRQGQRV